MVSGGEGLGSTHTLFHVRPVRGLGGVPRHTATPRGFKEAEVVPTRHHASMLEALVAASMVSLAGGAHADEPPIQLPRLDEDTGAT